VKMIYPVKHIAASVLLSVVLLSSPASAGEASLALELDLAQCLRLAQENNLDLANADQEVRKAETGVTSAAGARLPEVEFTTTYTRMEDESAAVPGVEIPGTQADLNLGASLPLYTGGLLRSSSKQARDGLGIAKENYRGALGDTLLEVTTLYYQLLGAQQQVSIAREALDVSMQHEKNIDTLLRKGIVAKVDLVRSQLDVAERERDLAAAETEELLASERLSAILFPHEIRTVTASGSFPEPVALDPVDKWHERAMELSPELKISSLSVEIARSDVSAARAEGKGTLSLFGNYGTSDEDFTLEEGSRYWNAGVNYTLSLYKGGRVKENILYETGSLVQAENSLISAKRAVREAVTVAWANAKLSVKQNATAARAIASAEENLRVVTLKYQQGLVPNTDVIDAQLAVTRSRLLRIRSLENFNIYFARLQRTVGALEEMP
jgi:outer membrane protein TolC